MLKQWYCLLATTLISQLINVLYDKMMKSKKTTIWQVAFDLQRAALQVKIDLKSSWKESQGVPGHMIDCHCCQDNYHLGIFLYVIKLLLPLTILLFSNIDVSRHILVVDTSTLGKSNMGRREYIFWLSPYHVLNVPWIYFATFALFILL
jgi:hypothetical protein